MAKKQKITTVKGFSDILPKSALWWRSIYSIGEDIAELHNFHFIETPVLEQADLFLRSLGDEVGESPEKFLFTFKPDQPTDGEKTGTKQLALRAEGTTPILRSYLENHLGYFSSPLRAYYRGPMFFRSGEAEINYQSYNWGFEIIGDGDPFYDAEIILTLRNFLINLGINDPVFRLNVVGCRVCRPNFFKKIRKFYQDNKSRLCKECAACHKKTPLKALQCMNEKCVALKDDMPIILDCLCSSCNNHFQGVLELIEDNEVNYLPDPHFVDIPGCYSKVIFGIYLSEEHNKKLGYGGRQDYLSEKIGGRQIPTVGGVLDLNKIIETLKEIKAEPKLKEKRKVFFMVLGKEAKKAGLPLIQKLRQSRIAVMEMVGKRSLKAQLKGAGKSGVEIALILGQKEVYDNSVIIRNLKNNTQEIIPQEKMLEEVRDKL